MLQSLLFKICEMIWGYFSIKYVHIMAKIKIHIWSSAEVKYGGFDHVQIKNNLLVKGLWVTEGRKSPKNKCVYGERKIVSGTEFSQCLKTLD